MSEEGRDALSPISFEYEYSAYGGARACLSDGVTTHYMQPSYVPSDPLFGLVSAVNKVLTYGGEAECTWQYEPTADYWILQREGDTLHLTVWGLHDGWLPADWTSNRSGPSFSATCDLWKFAAKVRLAVSRLEPLDEQYHDPTWVQRTPEYRVLCTVLDEHKRAHRLQSS
ncbi:MAG TPA: hypothetical protein VGR57_10760 [Ktedonobacterales bacterium]|nr:hypothetical protein [Ktedonobacterales bacterium]